jgi:hypothetical protein
MDWLNKLIEGALPSVNFLTAGLTLYLTYEAFKNRETSNEVTLKKDEKFRADRSMNNARHHLGTARVRTPSTPETKLI